MGFRRNATSFRNAKRMFLIFLGPHLKCHLITYRKGHSKIRKFSFTILYTSNVKF